MYQTSLINQNKETYARSDDLILGFSGDVYPSGQIPLSAVFVSNQGYNWRDDVDGPLFDEVDASYPYVYIGDYDRFSEILVTHTGEFAVSDWEYWAGEWVGFQPETDTFGQEGGSMAFEPPIDWQRRMFWAKDCFFVRATLATSGDIQLATSGETSFAQVISERLVKGVMLGAEIDVSGSDDWSFAFYRDIDLISTGRRKVNLANLTLFDPNISLGQSPAYTLELLDHAATPPAYQSLSTIVELPQLSPIPPEDFAIEILDHGEATGLGKARATWFVNKDFNSSRLPERFVLSVSGDFTPNTWTFGFDGNADYQKDVEFATQAFFADGDNVRDITWELYGARGDEASQIVDDTASMKAYCSLKTPETALSNKVRQQNGRYSYRITASCPDYVAGELVSGFQIRGPSINETVPSTDNTAVWDFEDIELTWRSYSVRAYVDYGSERSWSHESHISVATDGEQQDFPAATYQPTRFSAPGLAIYYTGLGLDDWIDEEAARVNPQTVGMAISGDPTGEPSINTMVSGDTGFYVYTTDESWEPLADYLYDLYPGDIADSIPVIIGNTIEDSETGLEVVEYWECIDNGGAGSLRRLSEAFRGHLEGLLGSGDIPELITNDATLRALDAFTVASYEKYGLQGRIFQGPAIVSLRGAISIQGGYLSDAPATSEMRIGPQRIPYGHLTSIGCVKDIAGSVSSVAGYQATPLIETPLYGGELAIELMPLKLWGSIPEASGQISWFEDYEVRDTLEGFSMLEGILRRQYADEVVEEFYDQDYVEFALEFDDEETVIDRNYDGAYVVHSSRLAVKYQDDVRVQLLPPRRTSAALPWYPTINPGRFVTSAGRYAITEFPLQTWSKKYGAPYKDVQYERTTVLDNTTLRVGFRPLYVVGRNIELIIEGKNRSTLIEDWDEENGLVFLSQPIHPNSNTLISYTYKETRFVYKDINLNPHEKWATSLLGKYVGIFIVDNSQTEAPTDVKDLFGVPKSIYHQVFDSIDDLQEYIAPSGYGLGYYYVCPRASGEIDWDNTTQRGGGIDLDVSFEDLVQRNKEAASNWDIGYFDGQPFSRMAAHVVVPSWMKDWLGEERIMAEIKAHAPAGTMILLKYDEGITVNGELEWPAPRT